MSRQRHRFGCLLFLASALLAAPFARSAQFYYVNDAFTNGDLHCTAPGHNANDGLTPSSPKADIQAIMDSYDVGPDDTIWVDTGGYTLCDSIVIHLNGNNLTASSFSTSAWLRAQTFDEGGIAAETQTLSWAAGGSALSGTVRLDYSANAGVTWTPIASSVPATSGAHVWNTTTASNSTQALWRVVLESDTSVSDVNDHVFTISNGATPSTNPTLECLTFNVGGIASGTQTLNWAAGGLAASDTVRLDFSADAGVTWSMMASQESVSVGRWLWYTASFPCTTQALWRVVLESNTNVWDVNDQVFEINNGRPQTVTDYYVNDAFTNGDVFCVAVGNDTNDGTSPSSPKASLQAILDTYDIEPGDTIWVDTGDYKLGHTITIGAADGGAAGDPVIVRGSDNEVAGGTIFRFVCSTSGVTVLQGIMNRGFEMGYPGLVVPYEPGTNEWKSYSAPGAKGMWDRSSIFTNELAMKLTVDEGGGSYALISQDVCLHNSNHVSGSVSFEGWFRGDLSRVGLYGERAGAFLKMEFLDASLQHIASPVENEWSNGRPLYGVNTSGQWVRVSINATNFPQATAFIRFAVGLNNFNSQLAATGWWDNVAAVIELDGGTVTCPTNGLLRIQDASWLTIEKLRLQQGIEGFHISGTEGILVRDCEIKENTTGIKSSESTVRIERTRIAGGTYGARCMSGRMDMDGCTFWNNRQWQVCLEGGIGTVSNSILATVNPGCSGVYIGNTATYYGDYNNHYVTANAFVGFSLYTNVISLAEWQALLAPQDAHSLCLDPQFIDPGAFDFHLKSRTGSWSAPLQAWVTHDVDSPCIDTADPSAPYSREPMPNGGHRNMGAYGNTPHASRSTDSDGDGLSDSLERYRLGSDPNNPDSDGDSMNDGDEFGAGTSLNDDTSVFAFDPIMNPPDSPDGVLVLTWPSSSGCVYNVEYSVDLISGFTPLAVNIPATPPFNTYSIDVRTVQGSYYRVTCNNP